MSQFVENFNQFPRPVRAAFQTFIVAWCWHYFSLYQFLLKGEIPIEQVAIGIMLFISLALFKNWGRVLSMVFNTLAICWYIWFMAIFYFADKTQLIVVSLVSLALFTVSTLSLFNRQTKEFFKQKSADKDKERARVIEEKTKSMEKNFKNKKKSKR